MDEFGIETAIYDVACHTEGCWNEGEVIRVPADDVAPLIICGACHLQIEDITKVGDEL